jgi:hypothetical protein
MKASIPVILVSSVVATCSWGQVGVQFQNRNGTADPGGSPVTNSLTGLRVDPQEGWVASLHYGPAGASEDSLVQIAVTPFNSPGFFNGGTVIVPLPTGNTATLQVRVWNATRFATYRDALASCRDLTGKSQPFLLQLQPTLPPGGLTLSGLHSFSLLPCEPIVASIALEPFGVTLCWSSQTNAVYRVESCADLGTQDWSVLLENAKATGSTTCVPSGVPAQEPQRFYRVVRTSSSQSQPVAE